MRNELRTGKPGELKLWQVVLPVVFLLILISYSLILRPRLLDQDAFPLEIIFICASAFTIAELRLLGFRWEEVQKSITAKLGRALPAFFILFSIGVIISSWIICGTIPMLVYYGIKIIHPNILYLLAFLVPLLFSTLTGTSFGSIGTIGVVIIGIATALDASLGITAGAIIGGAYFGDKLSPLSDTTNLAAMTVEVGLYEHIRSMLYTTLPSALVAGSAYLVLGFVYAPAAGSGAEEASLGLLESLRDLFNFNIFLLIPPLVVLGGSLKKKPAIPVMACSIFSACVLSFLFQEYTVSDILVSLVSGFNVEMAGWTEGAAPLAATLLNRGGIYELVELVVLTFVVFIFIGALDHIKAMPIIVDRIMGKAGSRPGTVLTSLLATIATTSITCNQYATIFIIGDAFKERFDQLGIPRQVLSRSLEDYGTMMVSIIPWHAGVVFSVSMLGVPFTDYWHWQLMSLVNLAVAPLLAVTGIGCFYRKDQPAK